VRWLWLASRRRCNRGWHTSSTVSYGLFPLCTLVFWFLIARSPSINGCFWSEGWVWKSKLGWGDFFPREEGLFSQILVLQVFLCLLWVCSRSTTVCTRSLTRISPGSFGRDPDRNISITLNWPAVCHPNEAGGLGILNSRKMNIALMLKWVCKLYQGTMLFGPRLSGPNIPPCLIFLLVPVWGLPVLEKPPQDQTFFKN
jgi:hypothetical protein